MIVNKLMVKHVPKQFAESDKQEFFKMFGGIDVISMTGKLKHCCVVTFHDEYNTKKALETLHQFEILGNRLVAEYVKPAHQLEANRLHSSAVLNKQTNVSKTEKEEEAESDKLKMFVEQQESVGIAPKLNVFHEFPDHLAYQYPDPNIMILTNIANALATVPKFYTQVLHLMNKMNLPPPFAGATLTPPLPGDSVDCRDVAVDTADLEGFFSSDESEIESESESHQKHKIYEQSNITEPLRKRRRMKVIAKSDQEKLNLTTPRMNKEVSLDKAFELGSSTKRFEFRLAASIQEAVDGKSKSVSYNVFDERGAFGKLHSEKVEKIDRTEEKAMLSKNRDIESEDEATDEEVRDAANYISLRELNENRMSIEEIQNMSQFKNYTPGEVTNRLYIKNLAKQVTEDDLKFIFHRFIVKSDNENSTLDIRLMQEGRMKGQAFITLPSDKIATKALKLTHGYVLHSKPMIIQYGRAAKNK